MLTTLCAMKQTPLRAEHEALHAHLTEFGGWEMPLRYASEKAEHQAVRSTAGMFDLSHMGQVWFTGPEAGAALDHALVGKLSGMRVGKAKYGLITDDSGHLLDDIITYRLADDRYLVVPNAGNTPVVVPALVERAAAFDVEVTDVTDSTALIAVQGPSSEDIVATVVGTEEAEAVRALGYYAIHACADGLLVARTGYTGEDGFELFVAGDRVVPLWRRISEVGAQFDMAICGLAARDSLRLEAGMPLFGHELTNDLTPFDPGYGRMVAFDTDFVGRAALEPLRDQTPTKVLIGLTGESARPARAGYAVLADDVEVGRVTSAGVSPTLGKPIAMAYVDRAHAEPGTELTIDVRGRALPFRVTALPFYSRPKTGGN